MEHAEHVAGGIAHLDRQLYRLPAVDRHRSRLGGGHRHASMQALATAHISIVPAKIEICGHRFHPAKLIGDATRFRDPKQLVAYVGLDPGVHSSGKFTASSNRISKRGSKRLRRILYIAVQCGLKNGANERLKTITRRKGKRASPTRLS